MRILVTGHRGYIGTVLVPLLIDAGHTVSGIDTGLFDDCVFGAEATSVPTLRKDVRDVSPDDIRGHDALMHLAAISNDPLGDLLSRIRNAQMRNKSKVSTPGSKMRARVLEVLKNEGYIRGYSSVEHKDGRSEFEIELKYFDGTPVIRGIERVSRPGRRVYASVKALPRVNNGLGISILSTPKGVMADHEARDQNVGGEILCTVF